MSDLELMLRTQSRLHLKCGAEGLAELFLNAANKIEELEANQSWIKIKDRLPDCTMESGEDHNSDGDPTWEGMVSKSVEISDGHNLARGHYRDDKTWKIYEAEHDFQIVDPDNVTHWKPIINLPKC